MNSKIIQLIHEMIKIIIIIILKSNPEVDPRFYNQVVDFKL